MNVSIEPVELSTDITNRDREAATVFNRRVLQEWRPDLDLSNGGPVDSLLVDGLSLITSRNSSDVDRAYLYQQLRAIANGEADPPDEDVDRLMANYFLERRQDTPATGRVMHVVNARRTYTLSASTRYQFGDQQFELGETFYVYPVGTANVDFDDPNNVVLQQVYDSESGAGYRFELPVRSIQPSPAAALTAGDRLSLVQPITDVVRTEASTNFLGGFARETNQQFVSRALDGIVARTASGGDAMRALAQDVVPRSDVAPLGSGNPLVTRDRTNPFNIATGGKADVYVKSGAIGRAGYPRLSAEVLDVGNRILRLRLSRERSAGLYRFNLIPIFINPPPVFTDGGLEIQDVQFLPWTDPDRFNPEMPDTSDRRGSARTTLQVDFIDNRETSSGFFVTLTNVGELIPNRYGLTTEYQPGVLALDQLLTNPEYRPAGSDLLVKAAVPCIVNLSVVAEAPADYNGLEGDQLSAALSTAVNTLPIRTRFLDAVVLGSLLKNIEPDLAVVSVTISGTIYGQDGADISLAPVGGRLTLPTNVNARVSPQNTYFTTTPALTSVTIV